MTLELTDTGVYEHTPQPIDQGVAQAMVSQTVSGGSLGGYVTPNYQTYYWNSYPVYICTDKTAKAIQILKQLEADKILKLTSVKSFIEMVEKIAGIL